MHVGAKIKNWISHARTHKQTKPIRRKTVTLDGSLKRLVPWIQPASLPVMAYRLPPRKEFSPPSERNIDLRWWPGENHSCTVDSNRARADDDEGVNHLQETEQPYQIQYALMMASNTWINMARRPAFPAKILCYSWWRNSLHVATIDPIDFFVTPFGMKGRSRFARDPLGRTLMVSTMMISFRRGTYHFCCCSEWLFSMQCNAMYVVTVCESKMLRSCLDNNWHGIMEREGMYYSDNKEMWHRGQTSFPEQTTPPTTKPKKRKKDRHNNITGTPINPKIRTAQNHVVIPAEQKWKQKNIITPNGLLLRYSYFYFYFPLLPKLRMIFYIQYIVYQYHILNISFASISSVWYIKSTTSHAPATSEKWYWVRPTKVSGFVVKYPQHEASS